MYLKTKRSDSQNPLQEIPYFKRKIRKSRLITEFRLLFVKVKITTIFFTDIRTKKKFTTKNNEQSNILPSTSER